MKKSADISPPRVPTCRLPNEFRREQILKAALEFVRENGFPALTCRGVAGAARCSYKTVARAFGNRQALARAITEYAAATGEEALATAGRRVQ